jgi:hypothetical protein
MGKEDGKANQPNIVRVRSESDLVRELDFSLVGYEVPDGKIFENEDQLNSWVGEQSIQTQEGPELLWKHLLKSHYDLMNGDPKHHEGLNIDDAHAFRQHLGTRLVLDHINEINLEEFPEEIHDRLKAQTQSVFLVNLQLCNAETDPEKRIEMSNKFVEDFSQNNELCENTIQHFYRMISASGELDKSYLDQIGSVLENSTHSPEMKQKTQNIINNIIGEQQLEQLEQLNAQNSKDIEKKALTPPSSPKKSFLARLKLPRPKSETIYDKPKQQEGFIKREDKRRKSEELHMPSGTIRS